LAKRIGPSSGGKLRPKFAAFEKCRISARF
jgi:hypothetical protein